jgi:hypothetical protein
MIVWTFILLFSIAGSHFIPIGPDFIAFALTSQFFALMSSVFAAVILFSISIKVKRN